MFKGEDGCRESLSINPVLNSFWVGGSAMHYIDLLCHLFSHGKFARSMFYSFINERSEEGVAKNKSITDINILDCDDSRLHNIFVDPDRRKILDVL